MKTGRSVRIGVLMGGLSAEREVSLKSGKAVNRALKSLGYNVVAIDTKGDLYAALKKNKVRRAFIALHGGHGENGPVQGMLEIMGIPYAGSGVLASALAMDKVASKKIFLYHKITKSLHSHKREGTGTVCAPKFFSSMTTEISCSAWKTASPGWATNP